MLGLDGHWAWQSSWALGSCLSVTLDTQMEYPRIGPFLLDIGDFLEEGTVCGGHKRYMVVSGGGRGTTLTGNLM